MRRICEYGSARERSEGASVVGGCMKRRSSETEKRWAETKIAHGLQRSRENVLVKSPARSFANDRAREQQAAREESLKQRDQANPVQSQWTMGVYHMLQCVWRRGGKEIWPASKPHVASPS